MLFFEHRSRINFNIKQVPPIPFRDFRALMMSVMISMHNALRGRDFFILLVLDHLHHFRTIQSGPKSAEERSCYLLLHYLIL